jgi:hypothetical protein
MNLAILAIKFLDLMAFKSQKCYVWSELNIASKNLSETSPLNRPRQTAAHTPEEDSVLLSSICHTIANVTVEQVSFVTTGGSML